MTLTADALHEAAATLSRALAQCADPAALTDQALTDSVRLLSRMQEAIVAQLAMNAAEIERRSARELGRDGLASREGFGSAAKFVQAITGSTMSESTRLLRLGEVLEAAPAGAPEETGGIGETGAAREPFDQARLTALPGPWHAPLGVAVRAGWLTAAQADAVRTGLESPRAGTHHDRWREAVVDLIGRAVEGLVTVDELRKLALRRLGALDAEAIAEAERARFEARSLKRYVRPDGMVHWSILADPETDALMWSALRIRNSTRHHGPRFVDKKEAQRQKELEQDPRTTEQLDYDEFTAIFRLGIQAGKGVIFSKVRPSVRIVVTADAIRDGGSAQLEGSAHPVSLATVERHVCATGYLPVIFDATGKALDVGRTERRFKPRQREALAIRDGGCRYPGCTAPPAMTEAHHITPWSEGGKTDLADGILLCWFHHLHLHNHGERIERRGQEYWLLRSGREPQRMPSDQALPRADQELRRAG